MLIYVNISCIAAGLSQFHPSNSFGYLLDVLDGVEQSDEIEPAPEQGFFGNKQPRFMFGSLLLVSFVILLSLNSLIADVCARFFVSEYFPAHLV